MLIMLILVFYFVSELCVIHGADPPKYDEHCPKDLCHDDFEPHTPLVPCKNLPLEFLTCEEPLDLKNNETAREELGYGCTKFGGQRYEDVQFTAVSCSVLNGIECKAPRTFMKNGFPCIK